MSLTAQCAIAMLEAYGVVGVTIEQAYNPAWMAYDYVVKFLDRAPCLVRIDHHPHPIAEVDAMQITEAVLEHLTNE